MLHSITTYHLDMIKMNNVSKKLSAYSEDDLSAFSFLSPDDLKKVAPFFQYKKFPSKKILWKEGDPCDYMAFIVSGRVKIKKKTKLKGNQVVLGIHGKGAYIGALGILDNSPRAVTAQAMGNVSVVLISQKDFDMLSKKHPDLGAALMKGMFVAVSKRLKSSFNRLVAVF
ncbi:MAG: cyclic nucleotide-binding domain-containing protein [Nitrospiraceae bacterium]|nr:MAG: cyclic nucleotide-binding domain-containing protein [Nitrospiraceae bacterium]